MSIYDHIVCLMNKSGQLLTHITDIKMIFWRTKGFVNDHSSASVRGYFHNFLCDGHSGNNGHCKGDMVGLEAVVTSLTVCTC